MTVAHPPPARQPVLRFAPSPNGLLHLGHARSALENERMAATIGGRLLLRIEDIDQARCRPEHEAAMIADLAWLGLAFETPYRRQSDHLADHAALLARLAAMGLVYPAFESRGDVKALAAAAAAATGQPVATDPDGAPLYAGRGREMPAEEAAARIAAGEPHALRLAMDAALARLDRPLTWTEVDAAGIPLRTVTAHPQRWGDVVLARKDLGTSYHLAVVADDALQGVTHVVRGADLFEATAVHRLLQELLGLPAPLYRHHALVLGANGKKLSKSDQAEGFRALRQAGVSAEEVRAKLGF